MWLNHQVGCTERSQKARTKPCPVVRRTVRKLNCCGDPRARTGRKEVRAPIQCGHGSLAEKHAEQSDVQTHLLEPDERLASQCQLRETGDGFLFLTLTTSREWQMKKEPTNCKTSEARPWPRWALRSTRRERTAWTPFILTDKENIVCGHGAQLDDDRRTRRYQSEGPPRKSK